MPDEYPFRFYHAGRKLTVSNSVWGGPICSDQDGSAVPISGDVEKAYLTARKLHGLVKKAKLIKDGNAAVDGSGVIVDRRTNHNAVPIPPSPRNRLSDP